MMTEPCKDEGCAQRIYQLERSLLKLKEDKDESLRVQKEEYEERLRVQKEYHDETLLAQQDATVKTYWAGFYPLPIGDFPLEIIALIADFVCDADHNYAHLCAMMLGSRRLRDGVSLSKSWRVVNEVVTHVDDVAERGRILLSRAESLNYASTGAERDHLLRYLRLSLHEARECLLPACGAGRLDCLRYLVETFDIKADDVRVNNNNSLRSACGRGHLPVVQFLHAAIGLTVDDARTDNNCALRRSCMNGHLPVVQYLHESFGLTADDARANTNEAVRYSCGNGHLPVVQYLHDSFGLTANDARACNNWALRYTCMNGHLPVVEYLHESFGLTVDDARADNSHSFRNACEKRRLPVVQYLHSGFGLMTGGPRDKMVLHGCYLRAQRSEFDDIVQYLTRLKSEDPTGPLRINVLPGGNT